MPKKPSSDAPLGILKLESRFPRLPGDIANPATWPFPVMIREVKGADPRRVVEGRAKGLLEPFIEGARALEAEGAAGITTSCGFLSLFQKDLAAAVRVPLAASSLMQVPLAAATLPPGKRVGIITISGRALASDHLAAAGVAPDTPVEGVEEGSELARVILQDLPELDAQAAARDVLDAAQRLIARHPEVGALVLECTNMAPYARRLGEVTGLPVHSVVNFITWFHASLRPPAWDPAVGA